MGKLIEKAIQAALIGIPAIVEYFRATKSECGHYHVEIKDDTDLPIVEDRLRKVIEEHDLHYDFNVPGKSQAFDLNAYWDTKEKRE